MIRRFISYLYSRQGLIAASLVCVTGLVLGQFLCRTYFDRLPTCHQLDFGSAKWIQLPTQTEGGYYRKDLYISRPIQEGWIAIAATGSYQLIVNNVIVDAAQLPAARPSGLYDITRLLTEGKNAIAVFVSGEWWSELPQIRVRGACYLIGNETVEFVSDSSWKVSAIGSTVPGRYAWSAPGLDDSAWPSAKEGRESERLSTVQRVGFDPETIESAPIGNWISGDDDSLHQVTFSYRTTLRSRPKEAWLQLSSNGTYDVLVNQEIAALAPTENQAVLFSASAPVVFPTRVFSTGDLPRLFGPSSGLPGTKISYSAVRQFPKFSFAPNALGLQAKIEQQTQAGAIRRQASPPGVESLPSYEYPVSSSEVSPLPRPPTGSGAVTYQYIWNPRLLQSLDLPSARTISIPVNPSMSPLALPSLGDIAPEPAPAVPQVMPLSASPGPEASAALAFTGYEISNFLRTGNNLITVRVRSSQPPPVLLASGFLRMADGGHLRFGSDSDWRVGSDSPGQPRRARIVGEYWSAPWGPPVQVPANALLLPGQGSKLAGSWILCLMAATLFQLVAWIAFGWLTRSPVATPDYLWNSDAIMHLPLLLAMLGCLLATYDVRLAYDWCFRPALIFTFAVILMVGKLLSFTQRNRRNSFDEADRAFPPLIAWTIPLGVLILLGAIGLALRLPIMNSAPLGHDEVELALFSKGIFTTGFPHMIAGSYNRLLSTYELVTYPMALCRLILGSSVLWYRLPSLVFGTLTIGLIGWVGYRLFDWRVGLTAATIWTFLPIALNWSADGFYPSQEVFFATTTVWLFYEAIRERPLNPRYLIATSVAFLLAYLSWEASGFMIFGLFTGLLALRRRDWEWVRDRYLWRCFGIVIAIVVLQLCFRQLTLIPDYLGFIRDLSQLTSPAFVPLDRLVFDPLYYVKILFFSENQAVLTLLAFAGLLVATRKQALLYLDVLLLTFYLSYTLFLDHYAPRYCINWLPLLVLSGSASLFYLLDLVREIAQSRLSRATTVACGTIGLLLLLVGSNQYISKLFRIAPDPANPVYFDRLGVEFKANYGDADRFVASHLADGDVVVTRAPHVFLFTTGRRPDYCFDPRLMMRVFFDGGQKPPGYIDKWLGIRQLRSIQELKDVQARSHRVWIIADMTHSLDEAYTQEVNNYLLANGQFAYESAAQRVIVLNGVGATSIATP